MPFNIHPTSGQIFGLIGSGVTLYYRLFKKQTDRQIKDTREWFLLKFSAKYRERKWREAADAEREEKKRNDEAIKRRKLSEVDRIIERICYLYHFNRVTVASYTGWTIRPTTLENYQSLRVTITNEVCDNADRVMGLFQNGDCYDLAPGIMKLDKSKLGYIPIPPDKDVPDIDAGDNEEQRMIQQIDVQNLYHVEKSYRFKLGEFVTDGSLAASFTNTASARELTNKEIREIRSFARQIYKIINSA